MYFFSSYIQPLCTASKLVVMSPHIKAFNVMQKHNVGGEIKGCSVWIWKLCFVYCFLCDQATLSRYRNQISHVGHSNSFVSVCTVQWVGKTGSKKIWCGRLFLKVDLLSAGCEGNHLIPTAGWQWMHHCTQTHTQIYNQIYRILICRLCVMHRIH